MSIYKKDGETYVSPSLFALLNYVILYIKIDS